MRLFWKVLQRTGIGVGTVVTFGPLIANALGVDMWGLAWEYWAMIGFLIFGGSLGSITWQLHSENKRLKIDQIKNLKSDQRFLDHCDGLAEAAYGLAGYVDILLRFREDSNVTVKGNLINGIEVVKPDKTERLQIAYTFRTQYLEKHLKVDKEYPLENLELTIETVTSDLHKRLNTLGVSRVFDLVPECPICKALLED